MPLPVVYALGLLKKAAASVNNEYGILEKRLLDAICKAAGIVVKLLVVTLLTIACVQKNLCTIKRRWISASFGAFDH